MSNPATGFWIKQVEAEVNKLFADLIDMSDYDKDKKNNQKQMHFYVYADRIYFDKLLRY
jgi:hypothetical protein